MMNENRWNAWLQIVASLGLIGGLVLVAVQIQQTRNLARVQLQIEATLVFQQVEIAMLGENPAEAWARSIRDPVPVTGGCQDRRQLAHPRGQPVAANGLHGGGGTR